MQTVLVKNIKKPLGFERVAENEKDPTSRRGLVSFEDLLHPCEKIKSH
jgi:hypothetical protein